MPSNACLPFGDSGPVNAMLKPILIGSLFWAVASPTNIAPTATAKAVPPIHAHVRLLRFCSIYFPPMNLIYFDANNDSVRRNGPPAPG
jgi:hypothetical protein